MERPLINHPCCATRFVGHSPTYFLFAIVVYYALNTVSIAAEPRPNILWITSEDHGPHMGCYGDAYATTPHVDRLAARGTVYRRAWSCAPVCAPARTTLITGLYPPSTGSEHMRSMVRAPAGKPMFPQLLRAAGYYCTNNAKEDYNITQPGKVWDESSNAAHWKHRQPGQPFFAVFNSAKSHESRIRKRPHRQVHDPAKVRIPAYHPDTPEVRRDWAQYYDCVSEADENAGDRLRELDEAGLADDTIVFYFADHGSGLPRNKRSACNSGLHVPLVIAIPEKFQSLRSKDFAVGGSSSRLVSFVDFAPTVLSLVGLKPPAWMQGQAFLGEYEAQPRELMFGFRGRMDERLDLVRSATDGRYVYVRNYMPHKVPGQHLAYMFETPTTRVWKRLYDEGKLNAAQSAFWQRKPPEELFDLESDPDEVHNLVDAPAARERLEALRAAQRGLAASIRDVGFLPEGEIHARSAGSSPYDMGHDRRRYPFEEVVDAAEAASRTDADAVETLLPLMRHADSAVRYWGATGLLIRGDLGSADARAALLGGLKDPSPFVQIACAEAIFHHGAPADRQQAESALLGLSDWGQQDVFVSIAALNAFGTGDLGAELKRAIRRLPAKGPSRDPRYAEYVSRLLKDLE